MRLARIEVAVLIRFLQTSAEPGAQAEVHVTADGYDVRVPFGDEAVRLELEDARPNAPAWPT